LVLVDTSVWIEFFRRRNALDIEKLVDFEEVVTCLPVIQEVLQGFRDEEAFRSARDAMFALPVVESPVSAPLYEEAIDLYRTARRRGLTIRSSVDCLVAACAIRNDLTVMHRDRDYPSLAEVSHLKQKRV